MLPILRLFLCFVIGFYAAIGHAYAAHSIPEDKSAGIILAYHRIGEDAYPATNLRLEQFKDHLQTLENGAYNTIALPALITAIQAGEELPDKTIALTFEGGYTSAYKNAFPLLIKREIPFTIFFASNYAIRGGSEYVSWRDLKSLTKYDFVDFGLLPANYGRLYTQDNQTILSQINKARVAFRKNLGREPTLFSYPFGEYSLAYKTLIADQGFTAALGLHSGAASSASDMHALPRFSMTEIYGDKERFEMVTNALPLPVTDMEPQDLYLTAPKTHFGFSVTKALSAALPKLSCFISGQDRPTIDIIGDTRIELHTAEPITESRTRLNCTLPGPKTAEDKPRWRWFSQMFVVEYSDSN